MRKLIFPILTMTSVFLSFTAPLALAEDQAEATTVTQEADAAPEAVDLQDIDLQDVEANAACYVYDNHPQACERERNCRYNYRVNRCVADAGGGGGGNRYQCWELDDYPSLCERQPQCTYNHRTTRCVRDEGGQNPQCWRFDDYPWDCQRNPYCSYNFRTNRCVIDRR